MDIRAEGQPDDNRKNNHIAVMNIMTQVVRSLACVAGGINIYSERVILAAELSARK